MSLGCTALAGIAIPASVTSIGYDAFDSCTGLASVTFAPNSQLTTIGGGAFASCTSLTGIDIPANVTSIGNYAFRATGLISVTIGAGVIGGYAFSNCTGLTSVTIGAGVTTIESRAFYFTTFTTLTSVTFAGTIASANFNATAFESLGDLRDKYLAGGAGTYTRVNTTWTKQ
jgi:hypothetical protein